MTVRVRRDVWKLAEWDPILLWYSRAIEIMQSRPGSDPASWAYQAAIHDVDSSSNSRFWSQCQHNSWFFLPWHRMYLAYFEDIVASIVKAEGGPEDWALPYWNYSDHSNPDARRIPPAFRALSRPGLAGNPLRIDQRKPDCNLGNIITNLNQVKLDDCLLEPRFIAQPTGGNPGFGGPQTGFNHSGGPIGKLERSPHGSIHNAVGGFMASFDTAGLDPLFWLHHANIDRLWVVWRKRNAVHLDPTQAQWLTGVTFQFHDAAGNMVTNRAQDVVDTVTTPPLSYRYEDESDPVVTAIMPQIVGAGAPLTQAIPELVGATESLTLTGRTTLARVLLQPATGPMALVPQPSEVYLNIENVTGSSNEVGYSVYVNLPEREHPAAYPELFAGSLPMFGLRESTRTDRDHSGSGLQYSLDITQIVQHLKSRDAWDPVNMTVTFIPETPTDGPEQLNAMAAMGAESPVRVGRLSLYYA